MLKKSVFYLFATAFIFAGQFLASNGLVTGEPPAFSARTLQDKDPMFQIKQGPALVYFWAEWCGICRSMQSNINTVLHDYPGITIAIRSGDDTRIRSYLADNQLNWPTINDRDGKIAQRYGARAVPAVLIVGANGDIVFATAGYSSEIGLRMRLQLAKLLF